MSTIILIRPGCTDFDDQQRIQGILDLPLNARGQLQVQKTLEEIRGLAFDIIYSSPCEPARSTALFLGEKLGIPVKELEGLRNVDQGLWQGLHIDELRRKHPKVFKQWQEEPDTICAPGGELFADAKDRVRKALEKPLKKNLNFATVASEPLASFIRCIVRGCKLENNQQTHHNSECKSWEILTENGHTPANGSTAHERFIAPQSFVESKPSRPGTDKAGISAQGVNPDEFNREA